MVYGIEMHPEGYAAADKAIMIVAARRSLAASILLLLAAGLLHVLAFPKFNFSLLSGLALVPLLLVVALEPSAGRRFLWGTVSGGVFFAGTCYWIYGVMRNFGGLGVAAAAGVFVLFFLTLALYWGLFGALAGYLWKPRWGPPAIPLLWVACEYARAHLLTGFPWLLTGYADRKSTRLNSSHIQKSRMPSSA